MRRVLGSLSLACAASPAADKALEGRLSSENAAPVAETLSSDAPTSTTETTETSTSVVWGALGNENEVTADGATGGGGLVRLHDGLWVRVELHEMLDASPCICIRVAQEAAAADAEMSRRGAVSEGGEGSEDTDVGDVITEKGWEVLVEMQRMTDDIAGHLAPGIGRLLWRGCDS